MQCVILAAGEGTRMRPLTLERPKPLIEVCGKSILWHIVNALPSEIDEIIIVVGYKGEMIREYCGEEFLGRRVTYVTQENPKAGTADALFSARDVARGTFLVLNGDDVHGKEALEKAVLCESGIIAAISENPQKFGVLDLHEDGTLRAIIEKPENPPSNFVNTGGYVLDVEIFSIDVALSAKGEYFLTDAVTEYARRHPMQVIRQEHWIPIGYPEDIAKAEALLCPQG